jgi:hypothetical protein
MSEPRNVSPGLEDQPREDAFNRRYFGDRGDGQDAGGWQWSSSGRNFPWLGILLVLIGIALLVQYLLPTVSVGTLVLLAIALAFLAGWLFGGSRIAVVPGLLVLALGVAELIEDLAVLGPAGEDVPGLASSALAIAFVVIWLIGQTRGRRSAWPLWGAAIFGLIGFVQLSGRLVGIPELGALWPVLIIVVGIALLLGARRRT